MEHTNRQLDPSTPKDLIQVDFQKILSRLLSAWWLFVLCLGIAVASGHFYLRYTTFEYSARAILLIKDAGQSGNISAQSILAANDALTGGKAMDNEIQILKSLTLMEKVVERLRLNVAYFRQGNFKETELYTASPFLVNSFQLAPTNTFGATFLLELKDYESFLLRETEEDEGIRYKYGVPFKNALGEFTISLNPKEAVIKGSHRLVIMPIEYAAYNYKAAVNIERIGDQSASSVLELSMLDPVPEKARDVLNTLIDVYNEEEIKDENIVFKNTLHFIDTRVASLVNELDSVEGGIQRYKSKNEIISENAASSMNYTVNEIRTAVQQISTYEIQKNLLASLEGFLVKDRLEHDLIPANLIADNPSLSGLVNQYNDLVIRNKQIAITASEINPTRIVLEDQLTDIRQLILETIQNLQRDLQIPISKIEQNIQQLKSSMNSIPGIEKKLVEKMRTQAVKENLFLYLLQKREETALSEAVTTAKTRTIDRARISKFPVYPKRKLVLTASACMGLLFPFLIVMLLGLFETKVDSEETIKQLTSIPILGRIAQAKGTESIVVKHGSRSAINEMFRLLRTNLNFINHTKKKQTIMLTSSVSGEGKTFIALNLGLTIALSGKKVVLLGMDLRKPKLATYLGATVDKGISNYLVGQSEVDDIIHPFKDNANLSYIVSGPIPPNPAELILSDRMETLLVELQGRYDYILIDTPPIGLVSDALLLRKFVDSILVVVRHKYTRKVMLKHLEELYNKKELQKVSLIFNGIKQGKKYGYGGGYYYGDNNGYYVEDK